MHTAMRVMSSPFSYFMVTVILPRRQTQSFHMSAAADPADLMLGRLLQVMLQDRVAAGS